MYDTITEDGKDTVLLYNDKHWYLCLGPNLTELVLFINLVSL